MDHVEYVYTTGMTEERARARLEDATVGILAVARDGEAYAIPMAHVLDGDRLLFRFGDEPDSQKVAFAEATRTATFTVTEYDESGDSWSVVVRGPIRATDLHPDDATINELYPPFRVFDEAVPDVTYDMYELEIEEITGRESVEAET